MQYRKLFQKLTSIVAQFGRWKLLNMKNENKASERKLIGGCKHEKQEEN